MKHAKIGFEAKGKLMILAEGYVVDIEQNAEQACLNIRVIPDELFRGHSLTIHWAMPDYIISSYCWNAEDENDMMQTYIQNYRNK